ncbi:MAG: undecaprenyl-diphosphate phosphatase [Deltaproteobacteria bacterium]|nr:undecaprenyl-diphosphate phosphatase [Deltaproteobacteria bacterium]
MIVIGSVPTAVIGLLFREAFERAFSSPTVAGLGLWLTALLLLWSRWPLRKHSARNTLHFIDALLVGLAQGAAITPGLSRSGSTIATGLLRGLDADLAFRFSFLLSLPAIFGASVLELRHVGVDYLQWQVVAAGFFSALVVGWLALRLLRAVVSKGKLFYFAPYCALLGTLALIFS